MVVHARIGGTAAVRPQFRRGTAQGSRARGTPSRSGARGRVCPGAHRLLQHLLTMRVLPSLSCLPVLALLALAPFAWGCASLHHAQLDEIDAQSGHLRPFEIHVSETGVNTKAVGTVASVALRSSTPSKLADVVALFQFGPKTGDVVFDDKFADSVAQQILNECPSARVTGLVSMRESTKYYAVSGEYVTVRGFCIVD